MQTAWRNWPFKNTTLLLLSVLLVFLLAETELVRSGIDSIGQLGYFGAFVVGLLFVSTFTVTPAAIILFNLADTLNPLAVALIAGAGSMLGDYLIFRYMRENIFDELGHVFKRMGGSYLVDLFKTPFFGWMLPFIGAVLIASPLPDEVGISMLGLSQLKHWQFLLLTFLLNTIGIFFVVILARSL